MKFRRGNSRKENKIKNLKKEKKKKLEEDFEKKVGVLEFNSRN